MKSSGEMRCASSSDARSMVSVNDVHPNYVYEFCPDHEMKFLKNLVNFMFPRLSVSDLQYL